MQFKNVKCFVVIFVWGFVSSVFAGSFGEDAHVKVFSYNGKEIYKVVFQSKKETSVTINLLDKQGNYLHTTTVDKTTGFAQPFNFSDLVSGEYTFEILNGKEKVVETVHYIKESEKVSKNLLVKIDASKRMVTIASYYGDKSNISVLFFNQTGDIILEDKLATLLDGKIYDLSNVKDKAVRVSIYYGDNFLKEVSL